MKAFYRTIFLILTALILHGCIDVGGVDLRSVSTLKGFGKIMIPRFIAHGANGVDISAVVKKLDARATDNWVEAWSETAEEYEQRGLKDLQNNNLDDAKYLLLKASVYYRIAGYPYPVDEGRREAQEKSVRLFRQYLKFLDNPPRPIVLSMETKKTTGYLRLPRANQKVPLVIILPAIDSTKEEMFWVEDHFLDKGFATFSIDIPGTGESEWPMRSDSERMFQKVLNYFQEDSSIMTDKIAVVGFNFGGYWALRTAAQNPRIAGVAAVAAPIHYTFNRTHLNQMPRFMAKIFLQACGAVDYQDMFNILAAFSLKDKDMLRDIKVPVLIIGSEKDILVPKEDVFILAEELKNQISLKIYKDQPFGIIDNLQSEVYPLIADWVEDIFER